MHHPLRPSYRRLLCVAALLASLSSAACARADQPLFDFGNNFNFASVAASDVKVSAAKGDRDYGLSIASSHDRPWPGITLPAPEGHWDLSRYEYIALKVKNSGDTEVTVCCRVDNPGADGTNNCVTASIALKPGASGILTVPFQRRTEGAPDVKLFGMRGYPFNTSTAQTIDPANVTQLIVFVPKPDADHLFQIGDIRAGGSYTPPPPLNAGPFFPFIDTFGQYIHRDWPGKVHSIAEMQQRRVDEAAELRQKPGPVDWDQYGGWNTGPTLAATGFFRTEKYRGKWWLVDPDGRLFFSNGIDCVGFQDVTPVDERAQWFQDFPGDKPEFAEFVRPHSQSQIGHYAGQSPRCFSFAGANLERKYGPDWKKASAKVIHRRLRSWGINTIGNWSDLDVIALRKTPYALNIWYGSKMIEGSEGYWGKFPDVFDPGFKTALTKRMAEEVGKSAGDPWCIGYFVDNEMSWGDETSLGLGALQSPADQAAKRAFVDDLKAKYGAIEKLNAAWGTQYEFWDGLLNSRQAPDAAKAGDDLKAFYTRTAELYFKTVKDAIKGVAPHQLYLGCRFAWVNPLAVNAATKYVDVVSYNIYQKSVADFQLPGAADVPVIIGEFHFGALDRGMFSPGLVEVHDQAERGQAYKDYVQGALRNPQIVGCHWFQYQDEPTTGRVLDEENYQIGFIDIAGTPYKETVSAARGVGYGMYQYRLGH